MQGSNFLLVNISTANKVQEQCHFFDNLNNIIENFIVDKEQKIVMGGDFNTAFDSDLNWYVKICSLLFLAFEVPPKADQM